MITSNRSQLGKLLIDNPDCIIHNSWNHRDKSEDIQTKEFLACSGILQYAASKNKWFIFISTSTSGNNYYIRAKREAEAIIKECYPNKYIICKLPTLISQGTLFEKFYTGEYINPSGNIVEFMTLDDAATFVNNYIKNPICGIFRPVKCIYKLPDYVIQSLADFYKVMHKEQFKHWHDVDKFYKE